MRNLGHKSVGYIEDSLQCGECVNECTENINATLSQFTKLRFVVHKDKSILVPTRVITKLPNSEQSDKGKVKTHKYINRQNQSTTGKL